MDRWKYNQGKQYDPQFKLRNRNYSEVRFVVHSQMNLKNEKGFNQNVTLQIRDSECTGIRIATFVRYVHDVPNQNPFIHFPLFLWENSSFSNRLWRYV
jgi:hypothetical protein